jgi:hypothetical protein
MLKLATLTAALIVQLATPPELNLTWFPLEGTLAPDPPPDESDQLAVSFQFPALDATQYLKPVVPNDQLVLLPALVELVAVTVAEAFEYCTSQ